MREVVITSVIRIAIGNFLGALSPFSATELGGKVIEEALAHPIGASGARVFTTLLYAMKERGVKRGYGFLLLRRH